MSTIIVAIGVAVASLIIPLFINLPLSDKRSITENIGMRRLISNHQQLIKYRDYRHTFRPTVAYLPWWATGSLQNQALTEAYITDSGHYELFLQLFRKDIRHLYGLKKIIQDLSQRLS